MQKIFVIEDDENIRNLVKIALEGYGYQVLAFETAEEALELVGKEQPDLAVFDLMLPGMDGLSAIRLIRNRDDEIKNIPIIVLTAKDKEYDKVVGLDGGADDYVTKPFRSAGACGENPFPSPAFGGAAACTWDRQDKNGRPCGGYGGQRSGYERGDGFPDL